MREHSGLAKSLILDGRRYDLEDVKDEIFIDLREGPGTQFLASTCYGQAVLDCRVVGSDYFILKVRSELRALLLTQLREVYKAFRVYRFADQWEGRVLLTDEMLLRFAPGTTHQEKESTLRRYFPNAGEEGEMEDGIYRLSGTFSEDPILVSNALLENPLIMAATPLIVALPRRLEQEAETEMAVALPETSHL